MTAHVYGNSHIKALTGLRGVGALLVVFYHFHQAETGILQPLFEFFGSVGVMVFFALSGYILTSIYDKRFYSGVSAFSYFDFLCKRIARIYPLHFFLLITMLLVYPRFVYAPDSGLRQVFTNLTLTQAWSFDRFSFIAASWSISVEFLFYILFPFFVFFMRRNISLFVFLGLGLVYGFENNYWIFFDSSKFSDEIIYILKLTNHNIFHYGAFLLWGFAHITFQIGAYLRSCSKITWRFYC